jgi:hypothetical protein
MGQCRSPQTGCIHRERESPCLYVFTFSFYTHITHSISFNVCLFIILLCLNWSA